MAKKIKKLIRCTYCASRVKRDKLATCSVCNNTRWIKNPELCLCNLCGGQTINIYNEPSGFIDAVVVGKYDSNYLSDCTSYKFSFCEKCLRELFNKCVIKPEIALFGRDVKYEKDLENHEHFLYLNSQEFNNKYVLGKCNEVKKCRYLAKYSIYTNNLPTNQCFCEKHKPDYGDIRPFCNHKLRIFA